MKRGGGATCIPCLDRHIICIKSNEHDPLPSTSSGTLRILLAHQTYLIQGAINQGTIKDETRPLRRLRLCVPSTWEQPTVVLRAGGRRLCPLRSGSLGLQGPRRSPTHSRTHHFAAINEILNNHELARQAVIRPHVRPFLKGDSIYSAIIDVLTITFAVHVFITRGIHRADKGGYIYSYMQFYHTSRDRERYTIHSP
jgi:hypothetical protein